MRPLASLAVLLLAATGPGAALAASDLDRDGLDDTSERQVVQRHLPWLRIDAGNLGAPGAGPLDAPHPAETRLGTGPWDQPATNCAWPIAPHRRGIALARIYPAAPYERTGFTTQPVRYSRSVDGAWLAAQPSRLGYWIARVSLVFANDCGGTGKRVGPLSRGVNAHRGDSETIVMSLVRDRRCLDPQQGGETPGGDGYRVLEVIAQAHVGTSWARLPFESLRASARRLVHAMEPPSIPEVRGAGARRRARRGRAARQRHAGHRLVASPVPDLARALEARPLPDARGLRARDAAAAASARSSNARTTASSRATTWPTSASRAFRSTRTTP